MNKHQTDAVSLVFGSIFLLAAAWWLLGRLVEVDVPRAGWFVAGGLVLLGLLGLVASTRPNRS